MENPQANPAPTASRPASILIVDDDQGLLRLVDKTLRREGFATSMAGSGREALEWLSRNTADLLLLDLKLQDIDGKELVGHLESIGRSVPFIIITGQGDERVAVEMMKRGALDYLVKDVHFIEFVPAVVRRALEQLEKDRRLDAAQAALAESQRQILAISEREQRRFGAELHDGLGQQLTAIELLCQSLRQDLRSAPAPMEKQVSQICQFLREAIAQTRSLAHGLSPMNLDSGGLPESLNELALRMSDPGRLKCTFDSPSPVPVKDNVVAGHLFRIAQEAVNNAVKHAGATEVAIRLTKNPVGVSLEICDNGQGLSKTAASGQGIGMQIMKHRASVIGGELEVLSRPGKGVTVRCTLRTRK